MAEKLTEAQAKLASAVLSGAKLIRGAVTRSFFVERTAGGLEAVSSQMVERMMKKGVIQSTGRLDAHNGQIFALTDAGRAALARHRGETP